MLCIVLWSTCDVRHNGICTSSIKAYNTHDLRQVLDGGAAMVTAVVLSPPYLWRPALLGNLCTAVTKTRQLQLSTQVGCPVIKHEGHVHPVGRT
jgi:hypothetical protein